MPHHSVCYHLQQQQQEVQLSKNNIKNIEKMLLSSTIFLLDDALRANAPHFLANDMRFEEAAKSKNDISCSNLLLLKS
jgi:hypothetical protein